MANRKTFACIQWLVVGVFACTTPDESQVGYTMQLPNFNASSKVDHNCQQLIWQAYNTNRYSYSFDATHRLAECDAVENGYTLNEYAFRQKMSYDKAGLLQRVQYDRGFSQYHYHQGRLAFIDFFEDQQPIYRYQFDLNAQGQVVGLKGRPLQNSGLMAYSTRYRLDKQGRYVQLDVYTDKGLRYHRVVQQNFDPSVKNPFSLMSRMVYDLNRYPWITWGEVFPIQDALARHIETYRFSAPQTPDKLIKRSDVTVSWQTDGRGYITRQFSADALNRVQDTVVISYLNCR